MTDIRKESIVNCDNECFKKVLNDRYGTNGTRARIDESVYQPFLTVSSTSLDEIPLRFTTSGLEILDGDGSTRLSLSSSSSVSMHSSFKTMPNIDKVIFNPPATIIYWDNGTKTVVKTSEDDGFSEETGLAMALSKKYFGGRAEFLKAVKKAKRCQILDEEKPTSSMFQLKTTPCIYWGIFFEDKLWQLDAQDLLTVTKVICDKFFKNKDSLEKKTLVKNPHVTFGFKTPVPVDLVGKTARVRIISYGCDERNEAYGVDILDYKSFYKGAETPHITMSLTKHAKAVDSANLEFTEFETKPIVEGRIGYFDGYSVNFEVPQNSPW